MTTFSEDSQMSKRLRIKKYSRHEAAAAIQGRRIPEALGFPLLRICTIRGIRYNDGFGHELKGVLPEFTRALNARAIISNRIPDIANIEEETPYCIWYPEIASEQTSRDLVKKYPHMSYPVGRACAVAGYTDLFMELDILPEVHIAEEVRESGHMDIFPNIMAKPVRYNVMNDYERTINSETPAVAFLNGDTAVRSSLDEKQEFSQVEPSEVVEGEDSDDDMGFGLFDSDGFCENTFNITEDMSIHDTYIEGRTDITSEYIAHGSLLMELLTNPLPADLPTVDKDGLICMAAYYGDLDRYVRLRRPTMVNGETDCCMRGIYHNTAFAVWWSKQTLPPRQNKMRLAISARFIMNNVLSHVDPTNVPYLIWYPNIASDSTYRKLAKMAPHAIPQILRACIFAGYVDLFDELLKDITPDEAVLKEAARSPIPYFRNALRTRVKAVGKEKIQSHELWKFYTSHNLIGSHYEIQKHLRWIKPSYGWDELYNGFSCDAFTTELMACLPEKWRIQADDEDDWKRLDYVNYPEQMKGGDGSKDPK